MLTCEFIDPEEQIASEEFRVVESFLRSTERTQLGWHYITDITWMYSKIKHWQKDLKVLDAGGGYGPLQFLLAEMGFDVTNIDMVLYDPPAAYQHRYKTRLQTLPSFRPTNYKEFIAPAVSKSFNANLKKWIKRTLIYKTWSTQKCVKSHNHWRSTVGLSNVPLGKIQWCVGNLCHMPEIPSSSFDAVVSLSAWEHIPLNLLDVALAEIHRVLKPNAFWAVTTSGTERPSTWLHEPSQGNCFSVSDLENRFGAYNYKSQDATSILAKYHQCDYLKDNLADFYKKSDKFGMPWGKWNPKYIPVGLNQ